MLAFSQLRDSLLSNNSNLCHKDIRLASTVGIICASFIHKAPENSIVTLDPSPLRTDFLPIQAPSRCTIKSFRWASKPAKHAG